MFQTYSISKIAAEAMARSCARRLKLPTTIARLNVPYGDRSGWPWPGLWAARTPAGRPAGRRELVAFTCRARPRRAAGSR
jgi:nucleoside-diphosphate-sugar epimerase